jgi:hexosaminidase
MMSNWLATCLVSSFLAATCVSVSASVAVLPKPVKLTEGQGAFTLRADTRILCADKELAAAGLPSYLKSVLAPATGFSGIRLEDSPGSGTASANSILLTTSGADTALGAEGYELIATPGGVAIRALTPAGVFYGIQTLRQLLPPAVFSPGSVQGVAWTVPAVQIWDKPALAWRGLMLDVGRHIFSVDDVKRWIDLLALHKMNTFHWHLTDDQGWRIEIKKYPGLTEIGGWRAESPKKGNRNQGDGTRYGGFFSQDQVRDIVAYAKSRYITVVPEIEMPGHGLAALSAYPEYSCTGGPFKPRTRWGVEADVYCAGNDKTFTFLEDILGEVLDLFPGTFVHIGGDECPKDRWNQCPKCKARMQAEGLKSAHELQSYFVRRIEKFLNAKGRRLIGWDEILEGGLAPNAAVMSWRGEKGGIEAASSGHDVVMTPTSHAYFDYGQSKSPGEPEVIGGFLPLDKVYSYNPVPDSIPADKRHHVLGVQGNLWTEYVYDFRKAEYMAYPRGCAMAELGWTPREQRQFADFRARLETHVKRLDALKVNYRKLD